MFFGILENSHKNPCARVFFLIKLQASASAFILWYIMLSRRYYILAGVVYWIFCSFHLTKLRNFPSSKIKTLLSSLFPQNWIPYCIEGTVCGKAYSMGKGILQFFLLFLQIESFDSKSGIFALSIWWRIENDNLKNSFIVYWAYICLFFFTILFSKSETTKIMLLNKKWKFWRGLNIWNKV